MHTSDGVQTDQRGQRLTLPPACSTEPVYPELCCFCFKCGRLSDMLLNIAVHAIFIKVNIINIIIIKLDTIHQG